MSWLQTKAAAKFWVTWFPIFLLSGWDVAVLVEGLMNIDHDEAIEYIVGFVVLNWRILLMRYALYRSRSNIMKYIQLLGGIGWFAVYSATGDTEHTSDKLDTVLTSLTAQIWYYSINILSGLLGIIFAPSGFVPVYVKETTMWTTYKTGICKNGKEKWKGFARCGKKGDPPEADNNPTFFVKRSRVDELCRFLKDAKTNKKDTTETTYRRLPLNPSMRF